MLLEDATELAALKAVAEKGGKVSSRRRGDEPGHGVLRGDRIVQRG
ncbi:hypothetical protein ACH4UM_41490 [Streptomyces sp. NPDC020801]